MIMPPFLPEHETQAIYDKIRHVPEVSMQFLMSIRTSLYGLPETMVAPSMPVVPPIVRFIDTIRETERHGPNSNGIPITWPAIQELSNRKIQDMRITHIEWNKWGGSTDFFTGLKFTNAIG